MFRVSVDVAPNLASVFPSGKGKIACVRPMVGGPSDMWTSPNCCLIPRDPVGSEARPKRPGQPRLRQGPVATKGCIYYMEESLAARLLLWGTRWRSQAAVCGPPLGHARRHRCPVPPANLCARARAARSAPSMCLASAPRQAGLRSALAGGDALPAIEDRARRTAAAAAQHSAGPFALRGRHRATAGRRTAPSALCPPPPPPCRHAVGPLCPPRSVRSFSGISTALSTRRRCKPIIGSRRSDRESVVLCRRWLSVALAGRASDATTPLFYDFWN